MGVTISPVNIEDRKALGIRSGDTVRVWQKIQEKGKTRLQAFEGLVLAHKHGGEPGATFTVRRLSSNVGVEKIFPLYSPMIDRIEIVKRSKVRRAKLYYIRKKVAREIKRQMRHMKMMDTSTVSDIEEKEAKKKTEEETGDVEEAKEEVKKTEALQENTDKEKEKVEDKVEKTKAEKKETKEETDEGTEGDKTLKKE